MYVNLSGLHVLLTGASGGIGQAVAAKLGEAGATVALHYCSESRKTEELALTLGNGSRAFQADFSRVEGPKKLLNEVLAEFGTLDVLINNASFHAAISMNEDSDKWLNTLNKTWRINFEACAFLTKKVINLWSKNSRSGRIINIGSTSALNGDHLVNFPYTATKAALHTLTQSVAHSFGKNHIKAFTVIPGMMNTSTSRRFLEIQHKIAKKTDKLDLSTLVSARAIAPLMVFLCSGFADHASGALMDMSLH